MIRVACLFFIASAAQADGVDVLFQDGDPLDRFVVYNTGCPLSDVTITLDFTNSRGQLVIDTERGGIGTRDPSDVTMTEGDATLRPIADGDRSLTLDVKTLPNLGAITVTLDVDDSVSLSEDDRVFANGREIAGSQVSLDFSGERVITTLDRSGRASAIIPATASACALS